MKSSYQCKGTEFWFEQGLTIAALALISWMCLAALLNVGSGLDNLNLIFTFETDEARLVERITANLANGDLDPRGHYNYGYFYETLAVFILKSFRYLGFHIDARAIGTTLRLLSLLSSTALLFIFYKVTRLLEVPRHLSLAGCVFLFAIPNLFHWSQQMHPDLLQTFLVMAALSVVILKDTFYWTVFAGSLAGLAFGTKYSGIFVLPFLILPTLLARGMRIVSWSEFGKILKLVMSVILAFLIGYCLPNFNALKNYNEALYDFWYESRHVANGDGEVISFNKFEWFSMLYREFGWVTSTFVILGLISVIYFTWKSLREDKAHWRILVTILAYVIGSFGYLFLCVNLREPRFTFHFIPTLMVLCVVGISSAYYKAPALVRNILSVLLLLSITIQSVRAVESTNWMSKKSLSPSLAVGAFLSKNFDNNKIILSDHYSYIPPEFTNVTKVWGVSDEFIAEYKPDILILTASTTGRWAWKNSSSFTEGKFSINESYGEVAAQKFQFLNSLFAPESKWKVVYENDDTVILSRKR